MLKIVLSFCRGQSLPGLPKRKLFPPSVPLAGSKKHDVHFFRGGGGLGFRVWGLGFGVWGLGFGVWGLGFRV